MRFAGVIPPVLVLLGATGMASGCATGGSSGGGGDDGGDESSSSSSSSSGGSSSSSGGSGKGWYCGESVGLCQCFTQPVQGYSAPSCTATYTCCATQPYNGGMTCGCTDSSPCTPANGAKQVSKCPP